MHLLKKWKQRDLPTIITVSLPDIVFMSLCFFIVVTKIRETERKVMTRVPTISELEKIADRSSNRFIYIGHPIPKYRKYFDTPDTPSIQLNDAFAKPSDIVQWATVYDQPEALRRKQTVSLQVDKSIKMGLVSEVKRELRRVNLRTVYYIANKKF